MNWDGVVENQLTMLKLNPANLEDELRSPPLVALMSRGYEPLGVPVPSEDIGGRPVMCLFLRPPRRPVAPPLDPRLGLVLLGLASSQLLLGVAVCALAFKALAG